MYSKRLEKQIQDMEGESEAKKIEVNGLLSAAFRVWSDTQAEEELIGDTQIYQLQTQMQAQR